MPRKDAKLFAAALDLDGHKLANAIMKRTGETKVELIARMIKEEHNRIINGETVSDSINTKLEEIIRVVSGINPKLSETQSELKSLRDGITKVFNIVAFIMKELFRFHSSASKVFARLTLKDNQSLSTLAREADTEAAESFSSTFEPVIKSNSVDLVNTLMKKPQTKTN